MDYRMRVGSIPTSLADRFPGFGFTVCFRGLASYPPVRVSMTNLVQ
jgi:hypothetical protein